MSRLSICLIVLVWCGDALGQQSAPDCMPPPAPQNLVSEACDADSETCSTWQRFRSQHPYPYQTIAFDHRQDADSFTLIFSEVPPVGTSSEYAHLFKSTFQVADESMHRLRYPVGLDGWLEDWVLTVEAGKGPKVNVPGPDGNPVQLPSDLVNRLEFASSALFGTRTFFYVEPVAQDSSAPVPRLPDLHVTASSLSSLAADRTAVWKVITDSSALAKTFADVTAGRTPGTFINPPIGIVALAIPTGTDVRVLRAEFRKFALSTDYLVGAMRPKRGGLLLFSRTRTVPLSVLPPLRFETLEALANSLGQPLAQSYERQRIFAGKIESGPYADWDWAPIYLSPQLQDTEFGTLLNIADQELKSWSECSRIRYASFDYPTPTEFPFGESTATSWVFKRTLSPSLIFNWNTKGFAAATNSAHGRIVTASGTTALPVSYIVPDDPTSKALRSFLRALEPETLEDPSTMDPALAASNAGSAYFAKLGDPILARVVQNVLLFQILGDAKPFKVPNPARRPQTQSRSEIVSNLLVAETTPWLQEILARPSATQTSGTDISDTDLKAAMKNNGLSPAQLAELLATPQVLAQRMLRLKTDIDLKYSGLGKLEAQAEQVVGELNEVEAKSLEEFTNRCHEIGGTLSELKEKGHTVLRCSYKYKSSSGDPSARLETSYKARIAALEAQLASIEREAETLQSDIKKRIASLRTMGQQSAFADGIGAELRQRASYSKDLNAVLTKVLQANTKSESRFSIQTPSVVLSQNAVDKNSVGGHNIDGLPWNVQTGSAKSAAGLRWIGDRPTVIVPPEKIGDSASVARSLVTGQPHEMVPAGELREALGLPEGPKGSFLERLASRGDLPDADAGLMTRANSCDCDVYVERLESNTSSIVRLKPPPSVKTIFGDSALVEDLSQVSSSKNISFAGFPVERATAIGEGAMRRSRAGSDLGSGSRFLESIATAKKLFARGTESISQVFQFRTKSGRPTIVALGQHAGREVFKQRPSWKNASIIPYKPSSSGMPIVEVRFGSDNVGDLRSMSVFVHDTNGEPVAMDPAVAARGSKKVIDKLARNKTEVSQAVKQIADQMYKDSKEAKSVNFFLEGVDKIAFRFERADDAILHIAAREKH